MFKRILLMGPPGSGKSTVGEYLTSALHLPLISVGKTLRNLPEDHVHKLTVESFMDSGSLAPTNIVAGILQERLQQPDVANGFILDGWGRTRENIAFYDPKVDVVIYISLPEEEIIKRITGRRICEENGHSCNIFETSSEAPLSCSQCEGKLIQRDDDTLPVVQHRIDIFNKETLPVIGDYLMLGLVHEVSGLGDPTTIALSILNIIKKGNNG
ncbi:MAG: nucleoside monophosphate kinase [Patescibacteria group bacterium]